MVGWMAEKPKVAVMREVTQGLWLFRQVKELGSMTTTSFYNFTFGLHIWTIAQLSCNSILTLDPVATDWTEEVGIQAVGFFNLVQQFPDIHHLQRRWNI